MDGMSPRVVTGRGTRLPTVAGYLWLLRSHLGAVVILTIVGGVLGLFAARQVPQEFKASASIELPDVPTWVDTRPDPPAPQRTTIDTTAQLVFSVPVYDAVAAATGLDQQVAADNLSVSAYPLSRVLIVTFQARNKETAIIGARAAADELVVQRAAVLPGAQVQAARDHEKKLNQLKLRAQQIQLYSPLTQRMTAYILQTRQAIGAALNAGGTVVNRPDENSARRVDKHSELQIVTGLVLGFLLGIAYAWWRRDKHLHHDPRIIGFVAKVRPWRRSAARSPQPARRPHSHPGHSHAH